jgi:hypothetical protein
LAEGVGDQISVIGGFRSTAMCRREATQSPLLSDGAATRGFPTQIAFGDVHPPLTLLASSVARIWDN